MYQCIILFGSEWHVEWEIWQYTGESKYIIIKCVSTGPNELNENSWSLIWTKKS